MTDFFQEVTEELRRDQYLDLWRRFGPYVIGLGVGIIAATAAWVIYSGMVRSSLEADGARYLDGVNALLEGSQDEALLVFEELTREGTDGYAMLSRFETAAAFQRLDRHDEALTAYTDIADDSGVPTRYRDLASFQVAMMLIDSGSLDDIDRWLAPLMSEDSYWRHSARELYAYVAFLRGNTIEARLIYTELATDGLVPVPIQLRAAELLAIMGTGRDGTSE